MLDRDVVYREIKGYVTCESNVEVEGFSRVHLEVEDVGLVLDECVLFVRAAFLDGSYFGGVCSFHVEVYS